MLVVRSLNCCSTAVKRCGPWSAPTTIERMRCEGWVPRLFVGDLTCAGGVVEAMDGVSRMFFNVSVSPD